MTSLFTKAVEEANYLHKTQKRKSYPFLPYIVHPLSVASLVREYAPCDTKNLEELMCVAVLHDTLEDCDVSRAYIEESFGKRVCELVEELTSDKEKIKKMGKTEYLIEKMTGMSDDAFFIKLCDRLDNVMDLRSVEDKEWVEKYKKQTIVLLNSLPRREFPHIQEITSLILDLAGCV